MPLAVGGDQQHPDRPTGSSTKLKRYFNHDKTHQGHKGKKGRRTREIHADSPLNVPFLKQIHMNAVAIYTVEPRADPHFIHTSPTVMNEQPGAPKQFGSRLEEETIEENKDLLGKIGSDSILKAPAIKGSMYFYINTCVDGQRIKEELIDDPTALDAAIKNLAIENLSIEINYENKHHRWVAQLPHALKVLEYAASRIRPSNNISPDGLGINAELKWRDEKDFENIIHLTQIKGNGEWQVSRFA
jgi:hypothetical protein